MLVYLSFPSRYPLESFDASGEFSLAVTLLLILLLLLKELSGYRKGGGWRRLGRALNFAIAPLLLVFLVEVGLRISEALR